MSLTSIFQDIADAIRSKTGKAESIYPVDMASEIEGISSGGGYKLEKMPSGAVSSFNDGTDLPLNKLKVSIESVQDLHGYDAPWVGGAGKNKFDKDDSNSIIEAYFSGSTPTIRVNGNAKTIFVKCKTSTTYTVSKTIGTRFIVGYTKELPIANAAVYGIISDSSQSAITITTGADAEYLVAFVYNVTSDTITAEAMIASLQVEEGSTATSYEPYSNICPISGWDEVNVTVANDVDNPTISNVYTFDLDGTRYGGTLDVVSGVLTVTNANIVSYNREIINEPWISSMDVYSAGTTPTTGAQVVYPLATPQTIQLTPTAVRSLIGLNNIWADTGDIINGEYFKGIASGGSDGIIKRNIRTGARVGSRLSLTANVYESEV